MIILPRQALDKHRENSKTDRFSLIGDGEDGEEDEFEDSYWNGTNSNSLSFPYVCPEPVLVK